MDHPSVERIPLVQKPFNFKKDLKCLHCNKKFKNETSLNYHAMFHTDSTPEPKPQPVKPSKPADSSDSDSDNDSKHLSLKHISNSVKRLTQNQKITPKPQQQQKPPQQQQQQKPIQQQEIKPQPVKKDVKSRRECEKCKKKFKDQMAYEYHKITFHVEQEHTASPAGSDKSGRTEPKQSEKAKKRKSASKATEVPVKKQKILSEKTDSLKSKCLTGIFRKTQKVSDYSDDDNQQVIASIKSTLSMMHGKKILSSGDSRNKARVNYKDDSDSDSEESEYERPSPPAKKKVVAKNGKPSKRIDIRKMFKRKESYDSSSSSSEDESPRSKKGAQKNPSKAKTVSSKTIENEFQSHSIDAILRSKDDKKDSKKSTSTKVTKPKEASKQVSKKMKTVTSDSEPEIVKKEIKTEPVVDIADSEDESSKIREKLFSSKNTKEKCENCNKNFKNNLVLKYHQLHCDATNNHKNNPVEKNILQSKKSAESPADKILKKLSEKVKEVPEMTSKSQDKANKDTTENKVECKKMSIDVKKISKDTMKKFKDDIDVPKKTTKQTKPTSPTKKIPQTKKTPSKSLPSKKQNVSFTKSGKVICPQCGKKYVDEMALEYHKITFHVEEKETKLFSESLYNEQLNFDKNVLKMTEADAVADDKPSKSSEDKKSSSSLQPTKSINKTPDKPAKKQEKPHNSAKPKDQKAAAPKKSSPAKVVKAKPVKIEPEKTKPVKSSGYCICDKPEREDMLG